MKCPATINVELTVSSKNRLFMLKICLPWNFSSIYIIFQNKWKTEWLFKCSHIDNISHCIDGSRPLWVVQLMLYINVTRWQACYLYFVTSNVNQWIFLKGTTRSLSICSGSSLTKSFYTQQALGLFLDYVIVCTSNVNQ